MRSLYQIAKSFHRKIETNQTTLELIDTLDRNNLSRTGFGISISTKFLEDFLKLMLNAGYQVAHKASSLKFFDYTEQEVMVYNISRERVTEYYVMYVPSLSLFSIRSLANANQQNIVPDSFFQASVYKGDQEALNGLVLTEGLSGIIFGGNAALFSNFGQMASTHWDSAHKLRVCLPCGQFNQLLRTPNQLENDERVYFIPYDENVTTKLTMVSQQLKMELIRTGSSGFILGDENKLLGFYSTSHLKHDDQDSNELILRLSDVSYVKKFSTLFNI